MRQIQSGQGTDAKQCKGGPEKRVGSWASIGRPSKTIHWPRTLWQKAERPLCREHLRFKSSRETARLLHCFVLDFSASMCRGANLSLAKGLLLRWIEKIYQQRSWLCVIGFGGGQARVLQPPCKATTLNEAWIAPIVGGGGTPVVKGSQLAEKVMADFCRKSQHQVIGLWLLTDGRFTELPSRPSEADICGIVDFESAKLPLGRARQLALHWRAEYSHVSDLLESQ